MYWPLMLGFLGSVPVAVAVDVARFGLLAVWDPVTDEQRDLPAPPRPPRAYTWSWSAAVLCAASPGAAAATTSAAAEVPSSLSTWAPLIPSRSSVSTHRRLKGGSLTLMCYSRWVPSWPELMWLPSSEGVGVVLLRTAVGFFIVGLKSGRSDQEARRGS
ncbi:uncharacterized protein [Setaria viridis]|uniref:uncharacterized protein n=1 Tax=Setaria viridis TaxID=4556 RepID=UPI003B3B848E